MSFFRKFTAIMHAPLLLPLVTTLAVGAVVYRALNPRESQATGSSQSQTANSGQSQWGSSTEPAANPNTSAGTNPGASAPVHEPAGTQPSTVDTRQGGNQVNAYAQNSGSVRMTILPRDTGAVYGHPGRAPAQAQSGSTATGNVAMPTQSVSSGAAGGAGTVQ
jgi:hypothetical protein